MQGGRDVDMRSEMIIAREHEAERSAGKYWEYLAGTLAPAVARSVATPD